MSSVSIVVPSYNERDNVKILVEKIDEALKNIDHEILFVDDSTDDTPKIIEEISKEKPYVKVKHRDNEKGLATAVILGFKLATGDYLACMDADLQHPPAILASMYAALEEGADFCIPSRLIPGGDDGGLNWYRKFVSGTARKIGQIMLPCLRKISDPTSGLFMFRREAIDKADLRPVGWKIMVEVLAMAKYRTITEIPYTFQQRNSGESKLDSKVTMQYLQQCVDLRKRAVRNHVDVTVWTSKHTEAMTKKHCEK